MRTVIDVIRALSGVIEDVTGSAPTTKDVTENFDRPSTFIRPLILAPEAARGLQRDYLEMEIVYYAPDGRKGWIRLLEVQAALAEALTRPVAVSETFALYPEELEFVPSREDMTLTCTFSLENYQLLPPEDADLAPMDDLVLGTEDPAGDAYDESEYTEPDDETHPEEEDPDPMGNLVSGGGGTP